MYHSILGWALFSKAYFTHLYFEDLNYILLIRMACLMFLIYITHRNLVEFSFFPGPLAFCKKAVERVSSEKNILNSSVECVEWSGVEWSGFF